LITSPSELAGSLSQSWPISDGCFVRQSIPELPRSEVGRRLVDRLTSTDPVPGTLFLRGSCLEEAKPHPRADIDLVLVSQSPERHRDARRLWAALRDLGRPVDILPLSPADLLASRPVSLLVGYRSLRVTGKPIAMPALRVDRCFVLEHWRLYAPLLIPRWLTGPEYARVCVVKQLVRSVAILRLMQEEEFSRDLELCTQWAEAAEPGPGRVFRRALTSLARVDEKMDLTLARSWLLETFKSRFKERFGTPEITTSFCHQ
jgi:hypothetical protein